MDAKQWITTASLCAGLGWGVAAAEDPAGGAVPGRPGGPDGPVPDRGNPERPMAEMFRRHDTNGDGSLSLEEFLAMERLGRVPEEKRREIFDRLDKDKDGKIQPHDLAKMHEGMSRGGKMPRLEDLDRDHSGGISFEEFRQGGFMAKLPEERQRALFVRMDRDGDGQLTPKDRPEGDGPGGGPWGPRMGALDKDGSGGVSFEEFSQSEGMKNAPPERRREVFDKLDRDRDGQLTPKDSVGGLPHRGGPDGRPAEGEGPNRGGGPGRGGMHPMSLDRNGDGVLSFEEFRQGPMVRGLSEDEQEDRFEALDKNHDLKLQADELPTPKREPGAKQDGKGHSVPQAPPPPGGAV